MKQAVFPSPSHIMKIKSKVWDIIKSQHLRFRCFYTNHSFIGTGVGGYRAPIPVLIKYHSIAWNCIVNFMHLNVKKRKFSTALAPLARIILHQGRIQDFHFFFFFFFGGAQKIICMCTHIMSAKLEVP